MTGNVRFATADVERRRSGPGRTRPVEGRDDLIGAAASTLSWVTSARHNYIDDARGVHPSPRGASKKRSFDLKDMTFFRSYVANRRVRGVHGHSNHRVGSGCPRNIPSGLGHGGAEITRSPFNGLAACQGSGISPAPEPETYISIKGKWHYLYRAVDKQGRSVDFMLRPDRGIAAAQAFFRRDRLGTSRLTGQPAIWLL